MYGGTVDVWYVALSLWDCVLVWQYGGRGLACQPTSRVRSVGVGWDVCQAPSPVWASSVRDRGWIRRPTVNVNGLIRGLSYAPRGDRQWE